MRLVVREYLSSLKEDQELDKFTAELLLGMDIITISKPQRGRQFGVDIAAYGIDPEDGVKKAFLVAVKQGDLDRDNWNSGKNAVRPTLDEIFDFYIPAILPSPYKELPKKIVVVCNGDLTQNVLPSWSGYTTSKSIKGQTEIVFWGVDELVLKVEQYLLNDNLFPNQVQKLLRRALALLDVNDYDLEDYYRLISEILTPPAAKEKSDRHSIKKLKLLNLCLNMLFKWAQDSNNLKPALLAAERTILNAWGWMSKHDLVNKGDVLMTFIQVLQTQRQVNLAYFAKVKSHCYVRDSFSIYGGGMASQIEYPLLI